MNWWSNSDMVVNLIVFATVLIAAGVGIGCLVKRK